MNLVTVGITKVQHHTTLYIMWHYKSYGNNWYMLSFLTPPDNPTIDIINFYTIFQSRK